MTDIFNFTQKLYKKFQNIFQKIIRNFEDVLTIYYIPSFPLLLFFIWLFIIIYYIYFKKNNKNIKIKERRNKSIEKKSKKNFNKMEIKRKKRRNNLKKVSKNFRKM